MKAKSYAGKWLLLVAILSLVLAACAGPGNAKHAPGSTSQGGGATPTVDAAAGAGAPTVGVAEGGTAEATGSLALRATSASTAGRASWYPLSAAANALTGAGATFPFPLYSKWFQEYERQTRVKINYQSIGSGGGIEQFNAGTVDFGATDAPMKAEEIQAARSNVLHVPMTLGAVAVTYNLPEAKVALKLDGATVAEVFLGKIKKWNDPKIAAQNQGARLPDTDIAVIHRSDSSGTSFIFTGWLSSQSPTWKDQVGVDKSVDWPTGLGAKGNEGVAAQIKQVPGAIGYNEIAYALQNRLSFASIKNPAGRYVAPQLENITAAAEGASAKLPEDLRVSILNAPGAGSYPVSSFTWIIVQEKLQDEAKARALVNALWWAIHDGQKFSNDLQYATLPQQVVQRDERQLMKIQVNGKPVVPKG